MCDLFALSASQHYTAATSLPLFAVRGRQNVHGWGIGFFRQRLPVVEKSGDQVFADGRLHVSFQRLARVVNSPIILAHIRYKTSGEVDECHAHPFVLNFWGQSWIFAHNGKAPAIEAYVSSHTPVLEASQRLGPGLRVFAGLFHRRRTPAAFHPVRRYPPGGPGALAPGVTRGNTIFSSPTARLSGLSPITGNFCCSRAVRSWRTPCSSPPSRRASARRTGRGWRPRRAVPANCCSSPGATWSCRRPAPLTKRDQGFLARGNNLQKIFNTLKGTEV